MVPLAGPITFPTKEDDSGSDHVASAYEMGETEVTYELWYAVRTWAESRAGSNKYTFWKPGLEGSSGGHYETAGSAPTAAKQQPVTYVTWFDMVVWLNALTELVNEQTGSSLTPVYYYDSSCTDMAKDSTPAAFVTEAGHSSASAYAKDGATGFRLPTSKEWELAARWRGSDNTNAVSNATFTTAPYFTKGDSASGTTAVYTNAAATGAVAWYMDNASGETQPVKGLAPNALGLYDMSGNVSELCFDRVPLFEDSSRIMRGAACTSSLSPTYGALQLGRVSGRVPHEFSSTTGFRPARTAP
jgi:formylglycine-generating enzyme required for sulfatase activity